MSGLAPGKVADTVIVGKSTCGKGAVGSCKKATTPARADCRRQQCRRDRSMNEWSRNIHARFRRSQALPAFCFRGARAGELRSQSIKEEIDDWRCVKCQHLTNDQSADDRDAERATQLSADAVAKRKRQCAEQRGERGHHDGAETQQTRLINRLERLLVFVALRVEREVDHHDRVLLHDADQQNDSDQARPRRVRCGRPAARESRRRQPTATSTRIVIG